LSSAQSAQSAEQARNATLAPGAAPPWFRAAIAQRPERVGTVVDGVHVRGRCWGPPGPGVVLVHGGAAHGGWWDHIGPLLATERRVLAVDLSGHGDSGHRGAYTLATWATELVALASAAGISDQPMVVGHSMGGYVALTVGCLAPQSVDGIVVIDSPVPGLAPERALAREPTVESMKKRYRTEQDVLARFRVIPPDPYVLGYVADHVAAESVVEDAGGWTWKFDPVSSSRDRTLPVTLVSGLTKRLAILRAEHGLITPAIAARMVTLYGRPAPVVELPGCGHHVPLDDPIALVVALRAVLGTWDSAPG
jgi:pimeloyl-ACP methyl ester carboxylesterase